MASSSTYSYASFRYVTDQKRDIDVPVGVALWNHEAGWLRVRLPAPGEKVAGVDANVSRPYLDATQRQLEGWLRRGDLPYSRNDVGPLTDEWWNTVRELLRFRVRLGEAHALDCRDPEHEIERLFEAVVSPEISSRQRVKRIDRAVQSALGHPLARLFRRRSSVPGYKGQDVPVIASAVDEHKEVIVDGVNLALKTGVEDADALCSKLQRIERGPKQLNKEFVLGYLASPGGLNGERYMKEWLEETIGVSLFDLDREADKFRERAEEATSGMAIDLVMTPAPAKRAKRKVG